MTRIQVLLFCIPLALGCVMRSHGEPTGADKLATITLSESQNGSTVQLSSDSKLLVRLPAQLGTGYVWTVVKQDDKVLRLAAKNVEGQQKLPGGTDLQLFQFSPVSQGSTDVELAYKQPWQNDQEPARVFRFRVVVRN